VFDSLLFLYFFTLHADKLSLSIGGFSLRLNNLIAFALLTLFFSRYRSKLFRMDRAIFFALLFLMASITISFLLSPYKKRCFFFLGWYGITVVGYFLLPYLLIRYYDAKKVFTVYLASFLVVGTYAFIQLIFSLAGANDPFAQQLILGHIVRPNAFAYEPSFYALYMTPFVVMINFHFLLDPGRPFFLFKKVTIKEVLLVNFLFFVSTATSAFFAFAIFCLCLLFFFWNGRLPQFRARFLKFCLGFVALFFLFGLTFPFIMKQYFMKFFYKGFMAHYSFFERWVGIENAWKVFVEHRFFGIGLGAYPSYLFDAFLQGGAQFTFIHQKRLIVDAFNPIKLFEPMNVFTEALASLGLIGAFALCGLIFVFVRRAKRAAQIDPVLGYNLLVSVLVMVIVLQFNQGLFRTYVWVHLALAFALVEKIVRETTPLSAQAPPQEDKMQAQEQIA